MASWSLAGSLVQLRREVDDAFPNRSTISDGTIGDAAHSARESDHNPDEFHVVRAMDITRDVQDGIDIADNLAEWLRAKRDPRVKYVIFNRRIFSSSIEPWTWRPYSGLNDHTHHVHISVMPHPIGDNGRPWGYDPKEDVVTEADKKEIIEGAAAAVVKALAITTGWKSDGTLSPAGVPGTEVGIKKAIAEIRGYALNLGVQRVPAMASDLEEIKARLEAIETALKPAP